MEMELQPDADELESDELREIFQMLDKVLHLLQCRPHEILVTMSGGFSRLSLRDRCATK